MNKTIDFTIFCLESFKNAHHLTGKNALQIFNEYDIFNYIESFYDVLHSSGQAFIIEDIDQFIKQRDEH